MVCWWELFLIKLTFPENNHYNHEQNIRNYLRHWRGPTPGVNWNWRGFDPWIEWFVVRSTFMFFFPWRQPSIHDTGQLGLKQKTTVLLACSISGSSLWWPEQLEFNGENPENEWCIEEEASKFEYYFATNVFLTPELWIYRRDSIEPAESYS